MDIDLKKRTIYIRALIRAAARTLTLKPTQMMQFYENVQVVRPILLKTDPDRLVVNLLGTAESGAVIKRHYKVIWDKKARTSLRRIYNYIKKLVHSASPAVSECLFEIPCHSKRPL